MAKFIYCSKCLKMTPHKLVFKKEKRWPTEKCIFCKREN